MFITTGIVVDAGAALVQDPFYDDKLKIRIPELHGFGDLVKNFQEKQYTKNEDLPWCKIVSYNVNVETKYPILQYKAQTYAPADLIYVQIDNESPNTTYLVTGLLTKYNEDVSDTSLTIYNNIDVSSILNNKVDFPQGLIDPSSNSGSSDADDEKLGGEDESTTVYNTTDYKEVFGYPFKNKQNVSCPFGKPGSWAAGKHTGIDLSGPIGTPIYSVGNGVVIESVAGHSSYGNYVIVQHGNIKGENLWTLYAHMDKKPLVKVGQTVKGTQEVNGEKQKGTQLGVRGSTGNSSGPHLHFEFRKGKNSYYSYTNPNKYISF